VYAVASYRTENSIGFLLGLCINRVTDEIDQSLADLGINARHFGILHAILRRRATSPSDLARLRYQSGPALSYTLNILAARKLLLRTRSGHDRRVTKLALTAAGRALTRTCIPRVVAAQNRVLQGLNQADYRRLSKLLQYIAAAGGPVGPRQTLNL
jgi:DNA-binding MarR family transcriptional regulator